MNSTVLIVDDEYAGRQTLESVLEGEGYNIEMAENGFQALEKVRELLPDVIILDVMMPGMTGFEVCEKIRNDPLVAEIPIIVLTALDDRESLLKALKAGADDFVTKPFDRYELRARLLGITQLNRYHKLVEERRKLQDANAQLMAAYEATIEGWSHAMDLRDKETEGHSRRVADMTEKLAKLHGVDGEDLVQIRRGSLLHDMGKLGVPDYILHKPDKLTDDEWIIMRMHPQFAYDMLHRIEYLRPALDIPFCHHEKWDGSGYPRGLKGEEIPVAARIFAIVDVWDALTSDRPYRPAWKEEDALAYIKDQSGKHFDPQLVELFFRSRVEKQEGGDANPGSRN
ncbi:MAG: two-component system response regulator [Anaerolineales bacterium]|nr:response regulator [Anaerolineae bacterium]PWB69636.1 MAG: two-component system response regulator [Anaerolineales bacterium]